VNHACDDIDAVQFIIYLQADRLPRKRVTEQFESLSLLEASKADAVVFSSILYSAPFSSFSFLLLTVGT
jgi:hypothetical protein